MPKPKHRQPLGQTIGGVLFGFEQAVLRNVPPPEELVHHARPDDPVPSGDGSLLTVTLPDDAPPVADGPMAREGDPGPGARGGAG